VRPPSSFTPMMIVLLTVIIYSLSHACDFQASDSFGFATSTRDREFFAYKNNGSEEFSPFFSISNCAESLGSKKFLMVAFGPQNIQVSDRVLAYDFSNQTRDSGCEIINSPFGSQETFSIRKEYLNEKWRAIRSCYKVVISSDQMSNLELPKTQVGCNLVKDNDSEYSFNGGFCFVRPTGPTPLKVSLRLKEECLDYQGLKKLDLKIFDFQAALKFYIAGDASGDSTDLTALSSYPLRFSTSPNENLLPSSDIIGKRSPQFPSHYPLPDLHLGAPEASLVRAGLVRLRIPLWSSNKCKPNCHDGFCQGLCDYAQGVAGKIELTNLTSPTSVDEKKIWFQGGILPPQYQGEVSGLSHNMEETHFKVGESYKLEMALGDPKFDFDYLRSELNSKIASLPAGLGSIGPGGIGNIPEIPTLGESAVIPAIARIEGINFLSSLSSRYQEAMNIFKKLFQFKFWPPSFQKICTDKNCIPIRENHTSLIMYFKVMGFNEQNNKYLIKVLKTQRASDLLAPYEFINPLMPAILCQRPDLMDEMN
jgi:hypothetical protein